VRERIAAFDWDRVADDLDTRGHAVLPGLLAADDCHALIATYADTARFRSFIDLAQHRFGDHGSYRYFARPLPKRVESLRVHLYPRLARIANRWAETLGQRERYPRGLAPFLKRCHEHGQERPTPLLLHYETDGYNCLHQDLYGAIAFPLQVAVPLLQVGEDFEGGEFLLTEQRPRMQSRGEAIRLDRGDALVFPNRARPAVGVRGPYAVQVRHGVSRVRSGERYALGIIFHDAR
jgi:hypothetical protein